MSRSQGQIAAALGRREKGLRLVASGMRLLLGGLFLWAAWSKLLDPAAFAEDIAAYRLLPAGWIPWVAATLPGVEVLAGLALWVGPWKRGATLLVGLLLVVFLLSLVQALLRGIDLSCGCFGGEDPADWGTVARDLLMIGAALFVWRFEGPRGEGIAPPGQGAAGARKARAFSRYADSAPDA